MLQGGCLIPLERTVDSERPVGARVDPITQQKIVILRRDIKERTFSPMPTDGSFTKGYTIWTQYYLKRRENESRLEFLEVSLAEMLTHDYSKPPVTPSEIVQDVRSIQGTTSWIALRSGGERIDDPTRTLEIIVFDEALHHQKITIRRIKPRPQGAQTSFDYLKFDDDRRHAVIQKIEGQFTLDLLTLTLTKA